MYPDQVRRTVVVVGLLAVAALLVACGANDSPAASSATTAAATSATAPPVSGATETSVPADPSFPAGTQHLHFEFGPVDVQPGQNSIEYSKGKIPKPDADGWILRMSANLKRADGTVPPVDVIHLHHGVWLNASRPDTTIPTFPERFFAAGEEKTTTEFPPGYGYQYRATDRWVLNYMLHNLTSQGEKIWVTYDLDFLPASAPAAADIVGAHPVWLDVQNGSGYPVFDVIKGTGTQRHLHVSRSGDGPVSGRPAEEHLAGRHRRRADRHRRPPPSRWAARRPVSRSQRPERAPLRVRSEVLRARGRRVVGCRR